MKRAGSYPKGIAKREDILTTALDVIAAQGYHRTSLREIAEATNLTAAGLLYYFGTKEDLLTEILRKRDEVNAGYVGDEDSPRIVKIVRHNMSTPGLVELYASLANAATHPTHPAHAFFKDRYVKIPENIAMEIRALQATGRVREDIDPDRFGRIMLAAADGLQEAWMLDDSVDMAAHLEYLWATIRMPPAESAAVEP